MAKYIEVKEDRSVLASLTLGLLVALAVVALISEPAAVAELVREAFRGLATAAEGLASFLQQVESNA